MIEQNMVFDTRYYNRHKPTIVLYYDWKTWVGDELRCWYEPIEDED